jgi:acetyl-CoA synthetase
LPDLEHVLIADHSSHSSELPAGTLDLNAMLEEESDQFTIPSTDPETPALLHFTSGTTGKPKGVIHVHAAVLAHYASAKYALDLHPKDIFWCTADPGWVTGISYGVIAPLVIGATVIADSGAFDAEGWYRLLQDQGVNVWYTAPTALRMMMRLDIDLARKYDLSQLHFVASVGEPLNAEAVLWGEKALNKPIHDTWWQTETGAIMIANLASMDIKPGSMGKPLPGIEVAIVERGGREGFKLLEAPDICGELALRTGWPSMFRGYLDEEQRYRNCFVEDWYLTGDLVRRDKDGYFWFVGRVDDMIKSAGHLIGPAEVERVLLTHAAVAEAVVIGEHDPLIYQSVKAYIILKSGYSGGETLKREILAHARKSLGASLAPREIEFCDELPRNLSGKVLRRVLQAREKEETSKKNSS